MVISCLLVPLLVEVDVVEMVRKSVNGEPLRSCEAVRVSGELTRL